jgi:hypothetical protein
LKFAVLLPCVKDRLDGTVTKAVLSLNSSMNVCGPAGLVKVTVPVAPCPPTNVVGFMVNDCTLGIGARTNT